MTNLTFPKASAKASFANRFEPTELTLAALPKPVDFPADLTIVQHRTGYSVVELSNGDVIKLHLHVSSLKYDALNNNFVPEFRLIPEVVLSANGRSFAREPGTVLS